MTLDNISIGMTIKNYKQFCELMDEPIKCGKSKIMQLAKWSKIIKFHRVGKVGYQIDEFLEVTADAFKRKPMPYIKKIDSFKLTEEQGMRSGVYIIYNDKEAYIGSSLKLRKRFLAHYENRNNNHTKTYNILHNGGVFEVLWFADENTSDTELRKKEQEYIKNYNGSLTLVNTVYNNFNKIILGKNKKNIKTIKCASYVKISVKDIDTINQMTASHNIVKITTNYIYFEIKKCQSSKDKND